MSQRPAMTGSHLGLLRLAQANGTGDPQQLRESPNTYR